MYPEVGCSGGCMLSGSVGELHCSKEKKRKVAHVTVFLLPNPVIPSQFIIQFMSHILLLDSLSYNRDNKYALISYKKDIKNIAV